MSDMPKRIIWGIDTFEEGSQTRDRIVTILRDFVKKGVRGIEIVPVYVLSPDYLEIPYEITVPGAHRYRASAEKALDKLLAGLKLPGLESPKVLINNRPSLTGAIETLLTFAKGADLVIVGSHGRKGLARLFLGSFAEALLLQSPIPVMVVGPHARAKRKSAGTRKILFPTDFSTQSRSAFHQALALARGMGAQLTLAHVIPTPTDPVLQSGVYMMGGGWVPVGAFIEDEKERKAKIAASWIAIAAQVGVKADSKIIAKSRSISESVESLARRGSYDMIAMSAQTGKVATILTGSITRQIVRAAPCPVWVIRPEAGAKASRAKASGRKKATNGAIVSPNLLV